MSTSLGSIEKAAAEVLRFPVDFGDAPQLVAGASGGAPNPLVLSVNINSFDVTCTGTGAPTVSGQRLDYPYQLSAVFTGGTPGGTYPATYTITLDDSDGTKIVRSGSIKVNA
jgi:hypothetical protein